MSALASSNGMIAAARDRVSETHSRQGLVALLTVVIPFHMMPSVVLHISLVQSKTQDDDQSTGRTAGWMRRFWPSWPVTRLITVGCKRVP